MEQKKTAPGFDEKIVLPQEPDFLQSSSEVSCIFNVGIHPQDVYTLGLIWGLYARTILPPYNAISLVIVESPVNL